MKKFNYSMVLLFVISILISGCNTEKKEWENSKLENTILVYEDFLNSYPEGLYSDSARIHLESLYFEEALLADTIPVCESFLQKYPQSVFADSIKILLEKLYYNQALEISTADALNSFIEKFPSSQFVPMANARLRTIELVKRFPFKIIVGEEVGLKKIFAGSNYTVSLLDGEAEYFESGGWLIERLDNKPLNLEKKYSGYNPIFYWTDQQFKISYNGKFVASFKNTDEYLKMIGQ